MGNLVKTRLNPTHMYKYPKGQQRWESWYIHKRKEGEKVRKRYSKLHFLHRPALRVEKLDGPYLPLLSPPALYA